MKCRFTKLLFALFIAAGATAAQAAPSVGKPINPLVGCDPINSCSISLDEFGNSSFVATPDAFFGPYVVTIAHIASTVNAAWVDVLGNPLEVTSYLVKGKGGIADIQLEAGALGICDRGVEADGSCTRLPGDARDTKGDVLIFTPLGVDAEGFGLTRIDFLSDTEAEFLFQTAFNVAEVGPEGNNGATHFAFGTDNNERMTYHIISDGCLSTNQADCGVPEPGTLVLVGLALGVAGLNGARRVRVSQRQARVVRRC